MQTLEHLPNDVRRALARSELRRRGVVIGRGNPALVASIAAFHAGVSKLPAFDAPGVPESWRRLMAAQGWPVAASFEEQVKALNARIVADCLSTVDRELLDSLPPCELSPFELVQLFAGIFNEF